MKQLTVNILGGRDVGKTTVAMHAVAELRWMGILTALSRGIAKFWGEEPAIVSMKVYDGRIWTPHSLAELCQGTLTFLVRRRKDYVYPPGIHPDLARQWNDFDEELENMMRESRVRYKSLPGVRASVPYIIKKICEGVGYDR